MQNLIDRPELSARIAELSAQLTELMRATGITQDSMPLDEGVKSELPAKSIR